LKENELNLPKNLFSHLLCRVLVQSQRWKLNARTNKILSCMSVQNELCISERHQKMKAWRWQDR